MDLNLKTVRYIARKNNKNYAQQWHAIANFVVNLRLRFARIFIFNRKYKVPNFVTDDKRQKVNGYFKTTCELTE